MTVPDYQHPQPGPVESSVAFISQECAALSESVPTLLEDVEGPEVAVLALHTLRLVRQQLQQIEAFVEAEAAKRLGKGKHEFPGFQVEVRGGASWKEWRHDDLAWALTRPIAVDPDTGEVNEDVAQIIDSVRSVLLNAARPSWRTTILAQHGLKPSDYATFEPSRKTVSITPAVDEGGDAA